MGTIEILEQADPKATALPQLSWSRGHRVPPLASETLHLWKIDCSASEPVGFSLLSPEERRRAERLPSRQQIRWIHAHVGLRRILSRYLGQPPRAIRFLRSPSGKPFLAEAALSFNLTTAARLALVVLHPSQPIGIDCERLRPLPRHAAIARRFLGMEVAQKIQQAPPEARAQLFFLAWTALEARVKADGRGLFHRQESPMPSFPVQHCIPESGYLAAIAGSSLPPLVKWQTFSLDLQC